MKRRIACLAWLSLLLAVVAGAQCDGITVVQEGASIVIRHDVDYNCAVREINHDVSLDEVTLSVTEVGVADAWADCYCPYTSRVEVNGLAPGEYSLVYAYGEMVAGEDPPEFLWCEMSFSVTDPTEDDFMVRTTAVGCGIVVTAVPPDMGDVSRSWSELKGWYR